MAVKFDKLLGKLREDDSGAAASHDHTATGDGGVLTGDEHDTFSAWTETTTPSDPSQNTMRLFTRANGSNIDLIVRSSTGEEAVLASLLDSGITPTERPLLLRHINQGSGAQ